MSKILRTPCRMPWLLLFATALLTSSLANRSHAVAPSFWSPPLNLSAIPGRSFQTATTRDPTSGDLFVVWTDDGVADREEILGRRWHQTQQKWLPLENLSHSESWQRDGGPALAFDNQGQGLLLWTRTYAASQGAPSDGYDLLWRKWDGSAWSPEAALLHGDSYLPGSPGTFGLIPVVMPDSILLFITWSTGGDDTPRQTVAPCPVVIAASRTSRMRPWVSRCRASHATTRARTTPSTPSASGVTASPACRTRSAVSPGACTR